MIKLKDVQSRWESCEPLDFIIGGSCVIVVVDGLIVDVKGLFSVVSNGIELVVVEGITVEVIIELKVVVTSSELSLDISS